MVKEGQVLDVELLGSKVGDKVKLETLAIVDGDNSEFGTPLLKQQSMSKEGTGNAIQK